MAIAYDNSTDSVSSGVTSKTLSYTTTGSNPGLVLCVVGDQVSDLITGATYNGVSMTQLDKMNNTFANGRYTYTYYLGGFVAGTYNIVVSASASTTIAMNVLSYSGVASTADNHTTGSTASASSFGQSITTVANNSWTCGFFAESGSSPAQYSAGASTTLRDPNGYMCSCDGNAAVTPAGSTTLTVSSSHAANQWMALLVSVAPYITPATNAPFFLKMVNQ